MIFTQLEFFYFLALVLVFVLAFKRSQVQKYFLLLASYYFYAYWDWRFLGLVVLCSAINFYGAAAVAAARTERARQCWLWLAVGLSLGILGVCKYYNFFIENLRLIFAGIGFNPGTLRILLPVGVSFFTFQCLSYTIDVYRRILTPLKSFSDFALYAAFFPQLMAGPIVRASEFIPQLQSRRRLTLLHFYSGLWQFVCGLFKKVVIADRVAVFADHVFANAELYDRTTLWLAALAYAVQIFCDFSGYSDMAIGVARMIGFRYSLNFNLPYISLSITEFWRRWHISLSSWLRDYLYISLGGNRKGELRTYANLLVTMLLGGLWHGAAWNFIFWGAWHGFWLGVHKFYLRFTRNPFGTALRERPLYRFGSWLLTFLIVLIGWVFFRCATFSAAAGFIAGMFSASTGFRWIEPFSIGVIAALTLYELCCYHHWAEAVRKPRPGSVYAWTLLFTMIGLVLLFRPEKLQPFIYFQF